MGLAVRNLGNLFRIVFCKLKKPMWVRGGAIAGGIVALVLTFAPAVLLALERSNYLAAGMLLALTLPVGASVGAAFGLRWATRGKQQGCIEPDLHHAKLRIH